MDAITTYEAKITANEQVDKWLSKLGAAASAANIDALLALFHADASWRDLLAFTWNIGTAEGRDAIREMLGAGFDHRAIEGHCSGCKSKQHRPQVADMPHR